MSTIKRIRKPAPVCLNFAHNLLKNKLFRYLLAFLPVGIFFWTIFRYSINIPYWDDYDILDFVLKFLDLKNLKDKTALIFAQHNEHRIAFDRMVALIDYYLYGGINFKHLIFIGNISLIGLTLVLFRAFRIEKDKFLYFIPAIYLLFQPQYWETIFWAMASLANLYVLFFAFLSIYFATKPSQRNFFLAVFFAILATFTSGSGMFVFLVVSAVLIYQKRFTTGLIWVTIMVIIILFYFHGYVKPSNHPSILNAIFRHPGNTAAYLFTFVGSTWILPHRIILNAIFRQPFTASHLYSFVGSPMALLHQMGLLPFAALMSLLLFDALMGLLPFAALTYLTKQKYYEKNLNVYSFLIFLFVTSFAVALARSGFGISHAYDSRYKIISNLFFILLYIALIETLDKERWLKRCFPIMLSIAVVFSIVSFYNNYRDITAHRTYLLSGLLQWQTSMNGLSSADAGRANNILIKSIQRKIYSVPQIDFHEIYEQREFPLPQETNNMTFAFEPKENNLLVAIVDGWAYINGQSSENTEIYIVLKSDKKTYIFDTLKQNRPDITAYFKTLNFDDSGFSAFIPKKGFERGVYKIGIYIRKNNIGSLQYTNKFVRIS